LVRACGLWVSSTFLQLLNSDKQELTASFVKGCFVSGMKNQENSWSSSLRWNFIRKRFLTYFELSGFKRSIGILTNLGLPSGFSKIESYEG
jgi:hypothetical protein